MCDTDYETMGYGWNSCSMKHQTVNNATLKNLIYCCVSVFLTWERKQVTRIFRKTGTTHLYLKLTFIFKNPLHEMPLTSRNIKFNFLENLN